MRNLDHKEDGLDRADWICCALDAVHSLIGVADDMHTIDGTDLCALLDILNRELALALRDIRHETPKACAPARS